MQSCLFIGLKFWQNTHVKFIRIFNKLHLLCNTFLFTPKEWYPPRLCEVLIYDGVDKQYIEPYLKDRSFSVLFIRGESINMLCLLRSIATRYFWQGRALHAYIQAFIKASKPKLILTLIDNNSNFYELSKNSGVTTMFIQNGTRGVGDDIFGDIYSLDSLDNHVDHMLVFGSAIGKKYRSFISGETTIIGSFRNNHINKSINAKSSSVLFISEYKTRDKNIPTFFTGGDGVLVSYDDFFSSEYKVLNFLTQWCSENHKLLTIAGRHGPAYSPKLEAGEKNFYSSMLDKCSYNLISRSSKYSTYQLIDSAEIVVSIDSTMGYEAMARGKKTALFSCRGINIKDKWLNFGWPAELPDNGPFWSNHQDEKQFKRIMDYLCTVSDQEFKETWQQYALEIMDYDPGNTHFIALLDRILA